jgi:hypothetical protein
MADDPCTEARDAWREAERAYREELGRYVSTAWGNEPLDEPEALTLAALESFSALRAAAAEAQEYYRSTCFGG